MLEKISNVSYDLVHEPTDEGLRKSASEGDQPAIDRAEFCKNLHQSGSQVATVVYILDTRILANHLLVLSCSSVGFSCPPLKSCGCSTESALRRDIRVWSESWPGGIWKTFFPRFFLTLSTLHFFVAFSVAFCLKKDMPTRLSMRLLSHSVVLDPAACPALPATSLCPGTHLTTLSCPTCNAFLDGGVLSRSGPGAWLWIRVTAAWESAKMTKPVTLSRVQSRVVGPYGYRASLLLHCSCYYLIVSFLLALIVPTWRWEDYDPREMAPY